MPVTTPRRGSDVRFAGRLIATLLLTLSCVGAVQYRLALSDVQESALAQRIEVHESDAHQVAAAFRSPPGGGDRVAALREALITIAARPGVDSALLVDRDGRVLAASAPGHESTATPTARAASRAGESSGRVRPDTTTEGRRQLEIVVPARLPIGTYSLEVTEQATRVFDQQVADLRRRSLSVLLLGLPIGVPIFYLFGGRTLAARHRDAVRRASRDGLTGLGNHRTFHEELRRQHAAALKHGAPLTLAVIDLDRFKAVNDGAGHRAGDAVLTTVAKLLGNGRATDQVFRVGGDEFAILLPTTDLASARTVLERLRADVERCALGVTLSVGISELGDTAADVTSLWECADAATYEAKRDGGNAVKRYDEVSGHGTASATQTRALQQLLGGEIDVAYQPIVGLDDGTVLGYEALARPHELHGLSGPTEAFAVAERLGLAGDLDARCRATALLKASTLPHDCLLFLNLAPAALQHPSLAGDQLLTAVASAGRTPSSIVLEISARSAVPLDTLRRETTRLRSLGFKLALDDVGSGHSGLEMLRAVPLDIVKVDQAVVAAAPVDAGARALLCAVVAYAGATGATVIAEGIETEAMLSHLLTITNDPAARGRVQAVQGHLLGRPLRTGPVAGQQPAQDAAALIR